MNIPIYDIKGQTKGLTMLITAGMDGDELCGIEAAKRLAKKYQSGDFYGRLIIIPVVNIEGNRRVVSWNPADQKFPKFIWPGKQNGSSTEKLIWWLKTNFADICDVWLDLHGGAKDEHCSPFVWFYETENINLNQKTENLINEMPAERVLYEKAKGCAKPNTLARQNCLYAIFESGELGKTEKINVNNHVRWVEYVMNQFGMFSSKYPPPSSEMEDFERASKIPALPIVKQNLKIIIKHVKMYFAPRDGYWHPDLNELRDQNNKIIKTIKPDSGNVFLWGKQKGFVKKGDCLAACGIHNA